MSPAEAPDTDSHSGDDDPGLEQPHRRGEPVSPPRPCIEGAPLSICIGPDRRHHDPLARCWECFRIAPSSVLMSLGSASDNDAAAVETDGRGER
ncbi:hypothetical protein [Haladaptatus sp. DFWS20]|uniref:hypothetical protein n=1 Tax=Haladaptatus sp. DFWS20 TaxID=3403467 RepID=UPI003EBB4A35